MKITLTLTKREIINKFAAEFGMDPNSIEIVIDESAPEPEPETPAADPVAEFVPDEGETSPAPAEEPQERFMAEYLKRNQVDALQAAKMTGLSISTIKRACQGYRLNSVSFGKLVRGLFMDDDDIRKLRKGMTRRQCP